MAPNAEWTYVIFIFKIKCNFITNYAYDKSQVGQSETVFGILFYTEHCF